MADDALERMVEAALGDAFRAGYTRHARLETGTDRRLRIYNLLWIIESAANYGRIARDAPGRRQPWRRWRRPLG
ncbi:hypothetical protein [Natronococcus wangiae]|uniref:hypothetical protein n=1 Tax=Natronococcus wangiae TaxID=3068275 RepID=UPI00274029D2|nr:hypothetical protein [Natronococcus sp. AD5]